MCNFEMRNITSQDFRKKMPQIILFVKSQKFVFEVL